MHLETASSAAQVLIAYSLAGFSAIAAVCHRLIGDTLPLPPGSEKLIDAGFAGLFILALLWGNIAQWRQRQTDSKTFQDALNVRDEKLEALEREVRISLLTDLREANTSRHQMIALMQRKENRDTE